MMNRELDTSAVPHTPPAGAASDHQEDHILWSELLGCLGDGLVCFDDQNRCTHANINAADILGRPVSDLLGRSAHEVLPDTPRLCKVRLVRGQVKPEGVEWRSPGAAWYKCVCCCWDTGWCVYFRNITEGKQVEEMLRASQERTALAQRAGRVGLFDWDMRTQRVVWTRELEELYGLLPGQFEGNCQAWLNCLLPEDRQNIQETIQSGIRERREELAYEYRMRRADGQHRWMAARARIFYDSSGQAVRMVGTCQDITETKLAEQALRESEQRFRVMGEALPYGVWWRGTDGKLEHVSQSFLDLLGMSFEEVRDGKWLTRLRPEEVEPTRQAWNEAARTQRDWDTELHLLGQDGRYHAVLSRGRVVRDSVGNVIGLVGINLNIDDRKQMEDKLRRNQRELRGLAATLERRVLQRTQELEDKTHRLRRLAADIGNAERRERERLAGVIHDHLQQILVAARMRVQLAKQGKPEIRADSLSKAATLLDEALQAARSLTTELRPPVLYEDGLIPALEWLAGRAKEQFQLDVALDLSPDAEPRWIELRATLFESVRELLFNISKHAKVSRARVELSRSERNEILVAVEDEGVGFSPSQVDDSGPGIGLFRLRERLIALGGQTDIDSVPGRGTRVMLIVPEEEISISREEQVVFETQAEIPAYATSATLPSGLIRIVVADDHRIVREGLVMLLESQTDMSVVGQAGDGREAVELTRQLKPDVVLMDLNMPVMNGIEATRIIAREIPDTIVLGLSAYGESGTAESMLSAGAVAYLTKGGEPEELIMAVRQQLAERVGSS